MTDEDQVTNRFVTMCCAFVAVILLASITACGVHNTEAETKRITACVSGGGQWLRVVNAPGNYECRRD